MHSAPDVTQRNAQAVKPVAWIPDPGVRGCGFTNREGDAFIRQYDRSLEKFNRASGRYEPYDG